MTNEEIRCFLTEHADEKYKTFNSGLIPGTDPIIGVRVPVMRGLAKQIAKGDFRTYLAAASDETYEELSLQAFVIGYAKMEISERLSYAAAFLPKIHDWSVNDGFCATFQAAKKHREEVWEFLMPYCDSEREFDQRVVAVMLMDHFLVDEYIDRVLAVYDSLKHEGYYCRMGVAWGVATAYAKFPEKTHAFLLENHLDDDTYNKAIQKMLESYRVTPEAKAVLRGMKRKASGQNA